MKLRLLPKSMGKSIKKYAGLHIKYYSIYISKSDFFIRHDIQRLASSTKK